MTLPPPPGPYGAQPSGGGEPQWGGPPPQGPGAPPPFGQPGQWPPQQWGAPPPSNNGGKAKWILGGIAITLAIALAVVITVLVVRPAGGDRQQSDTANGASEFASANDTGPANIITEDPTCDAWVKISQDMDAAVPEWNKQDYSVAVTEWTSEQRTVFENKSAALAIAIDKVTNLAKQTPHRIMRELYDQYHAYSQAVIDAIPTYAAVDNLIVAASNRFSATLSRVCDAINFHVAGEGAPLVETPSHPSSAATLEPYDPTGPERFITEPNDVCDEWITLAERYNKDTEAWRALDARVPALEWTAERRASMEAIAPVMMAYADDMERLGRKSGNSAWEDFAVFAAQYRRAYVQSIPTYTPGYSNMSAVSSFLSNAIFWACQAAM